MARYDLTPEFGEDAYDSWWIEDVVRDNGSPFYDEGPDEVTDHLFNAFLMAGREHELAKGSATRFLILQEWRRRIAEELPIEIVNWWIEDQSKN